MKHDIFYDYDAPKPRSAWLTRLRDATTWFIIQIAVATSMMVPHNNAMASTTVWSRPAPVVSALDAAGVDMSWGHFASQAQNWPTMFNPDVGLSTQSPKDNWALVARTRWVPPAGGGVGPGSASLEMIKGDRWITLNNDGAGQAGISNANVSGKISKLPSNGSYEFAQYSHENATLKITVQRVEKTPDGTIEVRQADFTPWHGQRWAATGSYRTAAEAAPQTPFPPVPGYNPFKNFEGLTASGLPNKQDPIFRNISWQGAEVAVGHAMRLYGADIGYVAVSDTRFAQATSTKSSLFKKKTTTTITGLVKPRWFVAVPMELGRSGGETGQICVTGGATPTAACDDPAHVTIAGVMLSEWKGGGNMPQQEDLIYQWVNQTSSWNILFFAVILALVTFGAALVLLPAAGLVVAGIGVSASGLAVAVGVGYALAFTNFGSSSVLAAQNGLFGSTGNGYIQQQAAGGVQQAGVMQAVQTNFVDSAMGAGTGGLTATDALYKGGCAAGWTVAQCQQNNLDPGTMWRPDNWSQYQGVRAMRQRMAYCTGVLRYSGVTAEQCAAPKAGQF